MPEQPDVRTPTRKPTPFPRFARKVATCLAALSVSEIAIAPLLISSNRRGCGRFGPRQRRLCVPMLLAIVCHGGFDRVLGKDRTVDLHRRQRQLFGDLRVL